MARDEWDEPSTDVADDVTSEGLLSTGAPGDSALQGATLVMLLGTTIGRRFALSPHSTLGRGAGNTVVIDDAKVSRHHAEMRLTPGGWVIHDCESRNGVVVNGTRIERDTTLKIGDEINIGEQTSFALSLPDPLQEQALQRQKMEAIGRLGAGVAHDFNNLLGAALATLDNLSSLPPKTPLGDPEVVECLDDVRAAAVRATELTRRLLRFSRRNAMDTIAVDVSRLCREVVQLVRRTVDRSITVEEDIDQRLLVDGHSGELHQVLMNLCINARDAMPNGGTLTISAQLVPEEALVGLPLQQRQPHVALQVTDTGRGIEPDSLNQVFEPFFTTKAADAGTGLGLATVYGIVTQHEGHVAAHSQPGEGATFNIYLPESTAKPAERQTRSVTPTPEGSETVLVVEDEKAIRRMIATGLRALGYRVLTAASGEEALAKVGAQDCVIDLLLTDVVMPGMNGRALADRMAETHPDCALVFMSGYTDGIIAQHGVLDPDVAFLHKPVTPAAVATRIRAMLDGRATRPTKA